MTKDNKPVKITEEEIIICRMYLEDQDKYKACNEYKLLQGLLDGTYYVDSAKEPSKERLAQLLCDYVTQDAESAEPDYIREVLDDIGMTRKEMEYVGLDWLIPDE